MAVMTLLSRKEFAEICGISKQAVAKMVKSGKLPATDDGYIDTGTDKCLTYLKKKGVDISELSMRDPAPVKSSIASAPPPRSMSSAGKVVDRQLLELAKLEADTDYRRLQAAKLEGDLVSRDVFERLIWGPVETFCTRILSDGAKTIASKIIPLVNTGATREEVELEVRKELSSQIKALQAAMTRSKRADVK